MTKALPLPARQVTALCRGAAKAGYTPIVQIGDVLVKLVPDDKALSVHNLDKIDDGEDFRL